MKRIILCVFILLILIALGIASYTFTNDAMDSTRREIEGISESFKSGDFERTKKLSYELSENWRYKYCNYLLIFDTDHIMEFTSAIARIEAFAQDENPEVLVECRAASELILLYRSKEKLEISNIL